MRYRTAFCVLKFLLKIFKNVGFTSKDISYLRFCILQRLKSVSDKNDSYNEYLRAELKICLLFNHCLRINYEY